jgi:putative salt-induced outer membrane protein
LRLRDNKHSEFEHSVDPSYRISKTEIDNNNEDNKGFIIRVAMEYKRKFSDYATFKQFVSTEVDQKFNKTKSETSLSTKLTGN